jgi:HSP20 family protein
MLSLKGNRKATEAREGRQCHVNERRHGSFLRVIPMPAPVDPDNVTAEAKDGVLHIRLAKAERAKSRQIPINSPPT